MSLVRNTEPAYRFIYVTGVEQPQPRVRWWHHIFGKPARVPPLPGYVTVEFKDGRTVTFKDVEPGTILPFTDWVTITGPAVARALWVLP